MLNKIINWRKLTIKISKLTSKQKKYIHFIDKRFFSNGINHYQSNSQDWSYETPINLDEELFYLHSLFDPRVLEIGAIRRFPQSVNRNYIPEKYFEDKWVSEGNNALANYLDRYIKENLDELKLKSKIKLLDIGPCGGAITTLFALKALTKYDLLDKVEIYLLDIVPEVLEVTKKGDFNIPSEMIDEYGLSFAGLFGNEYKKLMKSNKVHAIISDGEKLPKEIKEIDIALAGYVHHHMNLHARKLLAEQTEEATRIGGFIGVVDFYVNDFQNYFNWYKPHFEKCGTSPPVECPCVNGKTLLNWYKKTKLVKLNENLKNSFVFYGIKK